MDAQNISLKQAAIILMAVFGGVILLAGVLANWLDGNETPAVVSGERTAVWCAQERVKKMLKAPSTAKFPSRAESLVEQIDEQTYQVRSYVDAQNSFGAMLRTRYMCTVEFDEATGACRNDCTLEA